MTTCLENSMDKPMPQPVTLKKLKLNGSMKTYKDLLELTPKKDVLFIIGDWTAKVGSQETPGVTSPGQPCPWVLGDGPHTLVCLGFLLRLGQ